MAVVRPEVHGKFQQRPATITGYLSRGARHVVIAVAEPAAQDTKRPVRDAVEALMLMTGPPTRSALRAQLS